LKTNGQSISAEEGSPRLWRFEDCEFDDIRYELRVGDQVAELERKPLDLLRYLLSKSGEVVRKEELLEAVWPGVRVVDSSLATAISKLRKALGNREVIQTVPRVGYRIAVPVCSLHPTNEHYHASPEQPALSASESAGALAEDPVQWLRSGIARTAAWGALALLVAIGALIGVTESRGRTAAITPHPVSIAILPFQNASDNRGLDFLRFAFADEIANALATARSVTLRPTAASARFSTATVDLRKAGRQLDANRIVTGHFVLIGDRLHVTMGAVNPDEDRIVWHNSFDVPSNNLLAMQEQIAVTSRGGLANALGVREFIAEMAPRATNEEAYELYLKSVAIDWDPKPTKQAIELLRRVVLLDPSYAPAWGMLALRYYGDARFGGGGPEMMAFSDAAAEKQLSLNPDSVDPLAELTIHRTERGDLVKAHQIALELLRRRPDNPNLHHVLSYVLRYGGSLEGAGRECELAVLLASKVVWGSCSTTFMELGNYKRAKDFLRKDLSSEWSKAHTIEVLLREGKTDETTRIPAPQIPHWDSYKMLLACADHEPASQIQALALKVEVDDDPEVDYFFAAHLAYCGQNDAALRLLKIAIDHNYCSFPAVDKDPFFDGLRHNARFQKLRQVGIACHDDFVNNREKRQVTVAEAKSKQHSAGVTTPPIRPQSTGIASP
jgi:DNA-binding winged helix-turn-helix (wHTH) protein/TolB-like protein